jgi:hypothetical protein
MMPFATFSNSTLLKKVCGIISARESLVSDIAAGDGKKSIYFFYTVRDIYFSTQLSYLLRFYVILV